MDIDEDDRTPRYEVEDDGPADAAVVEIKGTVEHEKVLIVACGPASAHWAAGASLGTPIAHTYVNTRKVGQIYQHGVLVLDAAPLAAMYPLAESVIAAFSPTSIRLLDTHSLPTSDILTLSTTSTGTFTPPHLLDSPAAAFLSLALVLSLPAILFLLPSVPTTDLISKAHSHLRDYPWVPAPAPTPRRRIGDSSMYI